MTVKLTPEERALEALMSQTWRTMPVALKAEARSITPATLALAIVEAEPDKIGRTRYAISRDGIAGTDYWTSQSGPEHTIAREVELARLAFLYEQHGRCGETIAGDGRSVSVYPCDRVAVEGGLCGHHLAVKARDEKRRGRFAEQDAERRRRWDARERALAAGTARFRVVAQRLALDPELELTVVERDGAEPFAVVSVPVSELERLAITLGAAVAIGIES